MHTAYHAWGPWVVWQCGCLKCFGKRLGSQSVGSLTCEVSRPKGRAPESSNQSFHHLKSSALLPKPGAFSVQSVVLQPKLQFKFRT